VPGARPPAWIVLSTCTQVLADVGHTQFNRTISIHGGDLRRIFFDFVNIVPPAENDVLTHLWMCQLKRCLISLHLKVYQLCLRLCNLCINLFYTLHCFMFLFLVELVVVFPL